MFYASLTSEQTTNRTALGITQPLILVFLFAGYIVENAGTRVGYSLGNIQIRDKRTTVSVLRIVHCDFEWSQQ